ncbi:MAG: ParB N-terminal domain-containing protein [Pseudomonadota bacterium]
MLEWLPISNLVIDESYQRPLGDKNWAHIRRIAAAFNWAKFQSCLVTPVDGVFFAIIDGQHRTHAAALIGETSVPCLISEMDQRAAALSFTAVNAEVTAISSFHVYRAALTAGEDWACALGDLEPDFGVKVSTFQKSSATKSAGELFCIGLLRRYTSPERLPILRLVIGALSASRLRSDMTAWSQALIKPMLELVEGLPSRPSSAEVIAFLDGLDLQQIERAVARLKQQPTYARTSGLVLRREALTRLWNRRR